MSLVTLIDGRQVESNSEDWRHECEARAILNMPTLRARREHLYGKPDRFGKDRDGIMQRRGVDEVKRLEQTMLKLWEARKMATRSKKTAGVRNE